MYFLVFCGERYEKVDWVSLNSCYGRRLLRSFCGSFKGFKDRFFKVKGGNGCPRLFTDIVGQRNFPLY